MSISIGLYRNAALGNRLDGAYPLGDGTVSALVSNYITSDDITRFEQTAIAGATGLDVNGDAYTGTGWAASVKSAYDVGTDPNAWAMTQYDMAYHLLRQIDYFATVTPPAEYNEATWYDYVTAANGLYDGYASGAGTGFQTNSIYRYTEGYREIYLRKQANGSLNLPTIPQSTLESMRDNPSLSTITEYWNSSDYYVWSRATREMAYALQSHIDAEKCGVARDNDALDLFVDGALKKLSAYQSESNIVGSYQRLDTLDTKNYNETRERMKPWMMGIMIKALTDFYDWEVQNGRGADARVVGIPAAVKSWLEWLQQTAVVQSGNVADTASIGTRVWQADAETNTRYTPNVTISGFRYVDRNWDGGAAGSDDSESLDFILSGLTQYGYFWMAKYLLNNGNPTDAQTHLDIGEQLFRSALYSGNRRIGEYYANGKEYNQHMRWAFDCLDIRSEVIA